MHVFRSFTSKNNFPYTSEHSPQTPVLYVASLCIFHPQIAVEGESVIYWGVLNNLEKTSLHHPLPPQDPLWASKRPYFSEIMNESCLFKTNVQEPPHPSHEGSFLKALLLFQLSCYCERYLWNLQN